MGRKRRELRNFDRRPDPTPSEIEKLCQRIRANWPRHRTAEYETYWTLPEIHNPFFGPPSLDNLGKDEENGVDT